MPYKNKPKGSIEYNGYWSPAPGKNLTKSQKKTLAKVYGECRLKNPGEMPARKTKCSKIAWFVAKKTR